MTGIDRNVLRVGVWELSERGDVAAPVLLDELVELAKRFGTEGSGGFVNGILARIAREQGREVLTSASEGGLPAKPGRS
jgi:N utilization substance protein B